MTGQRQQETSLVKKAIQAEGYSNVRVRHGTGTACGWLKVYCDQKLGQSWQDKNRSVTQIAQRVTERHGEYDGRINVF